MIEVKNLSFRYRNNLPLILNDLSFSIDSGSVLSILGKNGVGKTTFIRCLTTEEKNYSGSILIDSREARDLSVTELSKLVAVVASNNPCYQNLCVADFLVTGFANKLTALQLPNKKQYEKACATLEELGHINLLNRAIFELSSGELQIVKIARAILQNPRVIVYDEPTSNLDIKNQLIVLNQITGLVERGYTVITTTHNPGQAIELGGKVLMMSGTHQIFGNTDEVLNEKNLQEVYGLTAFLEKGKFRDYAVFEDNLGMHKLVY